MDRRRSQGTHKRASKPLLYILRALGILSSDIVILYLCPLSESMLSVSHATLCLIL